MIKKIILFSIITITTNSLFAQNIDATLNNQNDLAILLTLSVAIVALVLSVINFFRISHHKKISEVELGNQRDDLKVTMEAVKVSVNNDVRYLKKEVMRTSQSQKNKNSTNTNKPLVTEENVQNESKAPKKKPFKKRTPNFKKRPPHKKAESNSNANEGENK